MAEQKVEKQAEEVSADAVKANNPSSSQEGDRFTWNGHVYLVMNATYRKIPDDTTYSNFWEGPIFNSDPLQSQPSSTDLPQGACLITPKTEGPVYMIDYKDPEVKRGFSSKTIFDVYQFTWGRIRTLEDIYVQAIPTGPSFDRKTY